MEDRIVHYKKYLPIAFMGILALGAGLSDRGPPSSMDGARDVAAVAAVLIVALIFRWYRRDALLRGFHITWGLHLGIVLLAVIALPWYLVRSRAGVGGRSRALAGLAASFVLVMACYRLGAGPGQ